MKLHFNTKQHIKPIMTKNRPKIIENQLYTVCDSKIIISNLKTFEIINEIKFDKINCFDIFNDHLIVAGTSIIIYNLSTGIQKTVPSKLITEITEILIDTGELLQNDNNFKLLIGRIDGTISKIKADDGMVIWEHKMSNYVKMIKKFENKYVSADEHEIWIIKDGYSPIKKNQDGVIGIGHNNGLYTVSEDGVITKWENNTEVFTLEHKCSSMFETDQGIYISSGSNLYFYSKTFVLISTYNIVTKEFIFKSEMNNSKRTKLVSNESFSEDDESHLNTLSVENENNEDISEDSNENETEDEIIAEEKSKSEESESTNECTDIQDTLGDDESGSDEVNNEVENLDFRKLSEEEHYECDLEINYIGPGVVTTTENEIFILDENMNVKILIIGNNDEITDIKLWKDIVFVATNSGRLRYTNIKNYNKENCVFYGQIVSGHVDSILSLSIQNHFLLTTSRDNKNILWRIEKINSKQKQPGAIFSDEFNAEITLKKIKTIETSNVQTSCILLENIFIMASEDGVLQMWDYKENFYTQKVHKKEITNISVNSERKIIATASKDKTAKIFTFDGKCLSTLSGHKKGIWCVCFGKGIMATCSGDATIRIWSLDNYSCLGTLEGHRSAVVKAAFYKNDNYLVSSCLTGEIKIWDVKRKICEANINVHTEKVWAFIVSPEFITCGNGELVLIEDDTEKHNNELLKIENEKKNTEIELQKCYRNDDTLRAVKILSNSDDQKGLFKCLYKCYEKRQEEVFDIFKNKQKLFFSTVMKGCTYKITEAVQWLLKGGIKRKWTCSKDIFEKIHSVLNKHSNAIDDVYIELLGFNILEKRLKSE